MGILELPCGNCRNVFNHRVNEYNLKSLFFQYCGLFAVSKSFQFIWVQWTVQSSGQCSSVVQMVRWGETAGIKKTPQISLIFIFSTFSILFCYSSSPLVRLHIDEQYMVGDKYRFKRKRKPKNKTAGT